MSDDLMTTIAAALAGPAATAVITGSGNALATVTRMVKERFSREPAAAAALDAAQQKPGQPAAVEQLRAALERVAADDEQFASRLRSSWRVVIDELGAVNSVSDHVGGNSLQANHVEGGVVFGDKPVTPPGPDGRGGPS